MYESPKWHTGLKFTFEIRNSKTIITANNIIISLKIRRLLKSPKNLAISISDK